MHHWVSKTLRARFVVMPYWQRKGIGQLQSTDYSAYYTAFL